VLFNSIDFLLIFLPIVLLLYHLPVPAMRLPLIVVSSWVFYGVSGLVPLLFLIISIVWGWAMAHLLRHKKGMIYTSACIALPLIILFLFKYLDFSLTLFGAGEETRSALLFFISVTLPAGISFYTFQVVSYSIDTRDGIIKPERSFLKFAAYISFFAQLIAGPILRFSEISSQFDRISSQRWVPVDARRGLKYLSVGLLGKIAIADVLGILHRNHHHVDFYAIGTSFDALFVVLSYSLQIYFDFWSYSLMALGLGLLLGLTLPVNFKEPYLSLSPKEFWRRWHVTLSYWLRDYLYLRIGGHDAYVRNILIVFVICGLWHGAGTSFVIWGAYHAVLVIFYHFTRGTWDRMPVIVQTVLTFTLISLGWPLFYADVNEYLALMAKVFSMDFSGHGIYGLKHWLFPLSVSAFIFIFREEKWLYNATYRPVFDHPLMHGVFFFTAILFTQFSQTFMYFRF